MPEAFSEWSNTAQATTDGAAVISYPLRPIEMDGGTQRVTLTIYGKQGADQSFANVLGVQYEVSSSADFTTVVEVNELSPGSDWIGTETAIQTEIAGLIDAHTYYARCRVRLS